MKSLKDQLNLILKEYIRLSDGAITECYAIAPTPADSLTYFTCVVKKKNEEKKTCSIFYNHLKSEFQVQAADGKLKQIDALHHATTFFAILI